MGCPVVGFDIAMIFNLKKVLQPPFQPSRLALCAYVSVSLAHSIQHLQASLALDKVLYSYYITPGP